MKQVTIARRRQWCCRLVLSAFASVALATTASADSGITLVSVRDVFAAIKDAQTVTLVAYALSARSTIVRDLIAAADRGARVSVAVDSQAFGSAAAENSTLMPLLEQHHVIVHYTSGASHIKAAVVDGGVYLSDRNWSSRANEEIVVADAIPADRVLIERAILGQPGSNDHLWTRKGDALSAEGRVLSSNGSRDLVAETESFGAGTPVFEALLKRADVGDRVRLIVAAAEYNVSASEQRAVQVLRMHRVEVRLGHADEKMAIDGDNVFIGSANATRGVPNQVEFGIAMRDGRVAEELRSQFEGEWGRAMAELSR